MAHFSGGLRWGGSFLRSSNVSFPLAKLEIDDSGLSFDAPTVSLHLDFADLTDISLKRRIFYKGIRFHHGREDLPKQIIFWTFSADSILEAIAPWTSIGSDLHGSKTLP
ncbi:MAG: hypothetical protein QM755_00300 [Luteolibacter sp.]